MLMIYDSDTFAVVEIEVPAAGTPPADEPRGVRGGYEIVDKLARTDIFLDGAMAQHFRDGVAALKRGGDPTSDQIEEFISHYTGLPQQPLVLH